MDNFFKQGMTEEGKMALEILPQAFTVCQIPADAVPIRGGTFCFVGKTDEELSLVCVTDKVPTDTLAREDGWRAFRICGVLDFSLIGILARIAAILAEKQIGIFVVSTYNTDYIFVKQAQLLSAQTALRVAGYTVL